jgi:hypothetical protein
MTDDKVSMFLATNGKFFPSNQLLNIKDKLSQADESRLMIVMASDYKDPMTLLIISIFLGYLGIDRFMLGDVGMGVLKLLTGGLCGVLTIIDWITIQDKCKEKNLQTLMLVL